MHHYLAMTASASRRFKVTCILSLLSLLLVVSRPAESSSCWGKVLEVWQKSVEGKLAVGLIAVTLVVGVGTPAYFIIDHAYQSRVQTLSPEEVQTLVRADPTAKEATHLRCGNVVYFIKEKRLNCLNNGLGQPQPGCVGLVGLVNYKNQVAGRTSDGRVYIYDPNDKGWYAIGNNARQIAAFDGRLLAVTANDELWVYKGNPGNPIQVPGFQYNPATHTAMSSQTTVGREVAFVDSGLKEVSGIEWVTTDQDGEIPEITFQNGSRRSLRSVLNPK
jgi:hypothetical protein